MEWLKLLIIPLLTIFTGGIGWLIKSKYESRKLERETLREQRFSAYFDAIEPLIDILVNVRNQNPNEVDSAIKKKNMPDYRRKIFHLLLLADDNVIKVWNKFWYELHHNPPNKLNNILHIDNIGELLVEIRKSLGYPNTKVNKRDMFTWYIKDIEHMDKLVNIAKKAQKLQKQ